MTTTEERWEAIGERRPPELDLERRDLFGNPTGQERSDAFHQREASQLIQQAADAHIERLLGSVRLVKPETPPAEYRPLSEIAKAAILGLAREFSAEHAQVRGAVPPVHHYFRPGDGKYVGPPSAFPAHVDRREYVEVLGGWTSIDLDGVRWSKGHPVLYGVHDEGQDPAPEPSTPEPEVTIEEVLGVTAASQPRRGARLRVSRR